MEPVSLVSPNAQSTELTQSQHRNLSISIDTHLTVATSSADSLISESATTTSQTESQNSATSENSKVNDTSCPILVLGDEFLTDMQSTRIFVKSNDEKSVLTPVTQFIDESGNSASCASGSVYSAYTFKTRVVDHHVDDFIENIQDGIIVIDRLNNEQGDIGESLDGVLSDESDSLLDSADSSLSGDDSSLYTDEISVDSFHTAFIDETLFSNDDVSISSCQTSMSTATCKTCIIDHSCIIDHTD